MKEYWRSPEGDIVLYHGDSLHLTALTDGAADLLICDPPFNVGKDYGPGIDDRKPEEEYRAWYQELVHEAYRVMGNGYVYVFCTSKQKYDLRPIWLGMGFMWQQDCAWVHMNLAAGRKAIRFPWREQHELVLMFRKGKRRAMLNGPWGTLTHNVWNFPSPQTNCKCNHRVYIAQHPLALAITVLARTPGTLILDPFVGSGTWLEAAYILERQAIGVDLSERACQLAARRLESRVRQGRLFEGIVRPAEEQLALAGGEG